jgi:1,4-dihydroxy-6-naphthoate synthase
MPSSALRLGFSPCPNDCFVFDALVHGRIDEGGLGFAASFDDVEALNQRAIAGDLDVAKVSIHAFGHLAQRAWLLRAGGALGRGVGPLIVTRPGGPADARALIGRSVAVPGGTTTALALLRLLVPDGVDLVVLRYDQIMPAVAAGRVDAGLIIHESRFTYAQHGLVAPLDLGAFWEARTGLPLPLGGIAVRRDLGVDVARAVERQVRASVAAAFADPAASEAFVAAHAQELSPAVRRAHIDLYVNEHSLDVGSLGERAIRTLLQEIAAIGLIPPPPADLFVPHDDRDAADAARR